MNPKRGSLSVALLTLGSTFSFACGAGHVGGLDGNVGVAPGEAKQAPSKGPIYNVYFGTYTEGWSCSDAFPCTGAGIYRATFNANTGALTEPVLAYATRNPSYLAVHTKGGLNYLYAVNEVGNHGGKSTGAVSAFRIESNGGLTLLNQVPSGGTDPAHVSVSRSGNYVLVANYGGGNVASFKILSDGNLAPADVEQHVGRGPHSRQEAPHAHFIANDEQGERVFVADLGLDQVLVYELDETTGALTPNNPPFGSVPPGSGPRHATFDEQGEFVYTNNELAQTVTVFDRDKTTHALTPIQTVSSLLPSDPQEGQSSEILMSKDGDHLYVGNRGPNSIGVFDVNKATGMINLKATVSTGGHWPRDFKFDPSGKFIVLGNTLSGDVKVFALDPDTGLPSATGGQIALNQVTNMAFVK